MEYSIDPLPNSTVEPYIEINGTIDPPNAIARLTINDVQVQLGADGKFSVRFPLELGSNTFEVRMVNTKGDSATETITVERVEPSKAVEEEGIGAAGWVIAVMLFIAGLLGGLGLLVIMRRARKGPEGPVAGTEEGPEQSNGEPQGESPPELLRTR